MISPCGLFYDSTKRQIFSSFRTKFQKKQFDGIVVANEFFLGQAFYVEFY